MADIHREHWQALMTSTEPLEVLSERFARALGFTDNSEVVYRDSNTIVWKEQGQKNLLSISYGYYHHRANQEVIISTNPIYP
ncbi:MAG: hypothetical protein ABIJ18_03865 [archaeon]